MRHRQALNGVSGNRKGGEISVFTAEGLGAWPPNGSRPGRRRRVSLWTRGGRQKQVSHEQSDNLGDSHAAHAATSVKPRTPPGANPGRSESVVIESSK